MTQRKTQVLDTLNALIKPDLELTNTFILEELNSRVPLIPELGFHLINSGGKRLRPILTLLAARMFNYQGQAHALMAAVVEFIHTATLLHDDVVDKSLTRRGKATANAVWGAKAPVLVGDFLFSRSFQILVKNRSLPVLAIIADACAVISEGEVLQLVATNDLGTTEEQYLDVVRSKTATLFSAAAQVGAVLGQSTPEQEAALARYGLLVGQAFQLVDDALDYSADSEVLGKTVGDDFLQGMMTLPVIHAYRRGDDEERAFWKRCVEEKQVDAASLQRAIHLVRERGGLDYALDLAGRFAREARECLAVLPETPEREAMAQIADFSVDRNF